MKATRLKNNERRVGLERRAQELAQAVDHLVEPHHVVVHVAEVGVDLVRHQVEVPVDGTPDLFTRRIPSYVSAPQDSTARGGALFGSLFGGPQKKKKDATLLRRGRDYFSSVKSDPTTSTFTPAPV